MSKEKMPPYSVFDKLPDELLIDIVCRLPFKEAARTSVLAKRWINIWRHTINIEIKQNFFFKEGICVSDLIRDQGIKVAVPFATFAANFLNTYRGRYITSFDLVIGETVMVLNRAFLRQFVDVAVARHVKCLTVDLTQPTWIQRAQPFGPKPVVDLPKRFYKNCERYESLNLSGVKISLSECNKFEVLRSVSLAWIELEDEDVQKLVAESPCLEELTLAHCWGFDVEFQSNSLKRLVVDKCNLDQDAVSIVAPNLKIFVYSGNFGDINLHENLANLEEVYIDFCLEKDFDHAWNLIYHQLAQFKNVRVLQVCSFVLQILPFCVDLLPINPKRLVLKTACFHPNDFHGVQYFLHSCKSIEEMQIDITERCLLNDYESPAVNDPDLFWENGSRIPAECLQNSLKVVEVKGFSGTKHQCHLLQLIMCLGKVLEKIVLFNKEGAQQEAKEGHQLLLETQKASSDLTITLCNNV